MNDQQIKSVERFIDAVRTKRFAEARGVLTRLEQDDSFWQPSVVGMRADLVLAEGHYDQAITMLSDYIATGKDVIDGCLNRRARIHFDQHDFRCAKRDYQAILDSRNPHAVTYFHSTAAYRIAWMLALEGNPAYRDYLAKCPRKDGDFFFGRIVEPADIHALFDEQAKRSDAVTATS